jgi:hypothetical protein
MVAVMRHVWQQIARAQVGLLKWQMQEYVRTLPEWQGVPYEGVRAYVDDLFAGRITVEIPRPTLRLVDDGKDAEQGASQ